MLTWLRRVFSGSPDDIRSMDDIEQRLLAEARLVRVLPSSKLHRRTLAALRDASLNNGAPRRWTRPGAAAIYADARVLRATGALGLLAVVVSLAALLLVSTRPETPGQDMDPLVVSMPAPRIDAAIRDQLRDLGTAWQDPLRTEAKLILADARQARAFLLARLPKPRTSAEAGQPRG